MPLPPGVTVRTSEFHGSLSAVLPVDPARTDGRTGMKINGRLECDGEVGGQPVRLIMTMSRQREQTVTLMPAVSR
jgi:hypothetical protein